MVQGFVRDLLAVQGIYKRIICGTGFIRDLLALQEIYEEFTSVTGNF